MACRSTFRTLGGPKTLREEARVPEIVRAGPAELLLLRGTTDPVSDGIPGTVIIARLLRNGRWVDFSTNGDPLA
jgi:hypothetical protein